jgi:Domain of Unknown Function with PDB structure (DUF3857)/Domain of Unknown Function with PDB structure (DUF3858)
MNRTQRFVCLTLVFCAFCAAFLARPRPVAAGDDWLPIPPADLAMKDNPADPGAPAMILYRENDIDAQEASDSECKRIKIFTQDGTKFGNVEIEFVKGQQDVRGIKGRTIQPDGTIVNFDGKILEKTIVKASGRQFLAKTFTLPDVHPGSIIEFKYTVQRDPAYYAYSLGWIISGPLYTRDARFSLRPDGRGFALPLIYRQYGLPADAVPVKQNNGNFTLDIHNVAGLDEEQYMPPLRALQVRVDFYYKNRDDPPNETEQQFWDRIGKARAEKVDKFIGKKGALEADLARTISPNDSPEVKLRKIYARVQKIRNLSVDGGKSSKEEKQEQIKPNNNVEDALNHNYASSPEINDTFIGLARTAGFTADKVWAAARITTFFNPQMRNLTELDTDLVMVHAGTQDYFLDPSATTYPFGIMPWYETSTRGLRCTKNGGEIVTIPGQVPSQSTHVRTADLTIDDEGNASGKLSVDYTGGFGAEQRESLGRADETGRSKSFEDHIKAMLPAGSTVEVTSITNWDNDELPVHVEGTVKIPNFGTSAGRRMLIPLSAFRARQPVAFEPEKRRYAIHFPTPYEEIDTIKFTGPDGYKFEAVPAAKQLRPGVVSYDIAATQQGSTVEVKRTLVLDGFMYPIKAYPALRSFFNQVKTNDDAQIVLQNAQSAKND